MHLIFTSCWAADMVTAGDLWDIFKILQKFYMDFSQIT